ncbi:MAG: nucleotide disphospho-sugar-binding domain-containing protein [Candidatus Flexifilum sp.]|jgi:MGT family glycosyltransferase
MAAIWCVSAPLYSHTDWGGFLKTACALHDRGHAVTWVSEEALRGAIAAAGLDFASIPATGWLWPPPPAPDLSALPPAEAVMLRYRRALDTWMSEDRVSAGVEALLALADDHGPPDLILTDPFLTAAALAAEKLAVPLVVAGWPAMRELNEDSLFPVQRQLSADSRERLARLYARFGLTGVNFSGGPAPAILSPHLHLSYFTRDWYISDDDNLLDQTEFVGGIVTPAAQPAPDWLAAIPEEVPLGVVTLGTTFTGDYGFYAWAAQACARAGLLPIAAVGWTPIPPDEKARLIAALPKGTRLVNYVDFAHVLPRARVLVHHGGMGTTHAAVVHGVPQIAVPHAADQRGNARRIAQARVGLNLSAHDVRQGLLMQGVAAIIRDEKVRARVEQVSAQFHALGGHDAAADAVEAVLRRG